MLIASADGKLDLFKSGKLDFTLWWAKVDGRQNRLRNVAGGSVILGIEPLAGSSSLFGWA